MLTDGICTTFEDEQLDDSRLLFFEIDGLLSEVAQDVETVLLQYVTNGMDVFMHRTGKGFHFISPTIIGKVQWKRIMENLKHINPKCPMTTMRWKPNKYPNEKEVWFSGKAHYEEKRERVNSIEMCNLLNKTFGTHFNGDISSTPKRVKYPLPQEWSRDQ